MNVTKRFFAEGEQRVGGGDAGNYYYTRDHLGSIREVTNSTGALTAQYDYEAWGKQVVVSGNMTVDFGYTGHYFHQPSGLNLAMYRAYDPELGRWISRDPLKEAELREGASLYQYVRNSPIASIDPIGLATKIVIKTDGVLDSGEMFTHAFSHISRFWEGLHAKYGKTARLLYRNVCTDPVFKNLVRVAASNGWGANIDKPDRPNDAHIDISSTRAISSFAITIASGLRVPWNPGEGVYLIAECSDGCGM